MSTDLSTQTPVEIDTALAEIYGRYYAAQRDLALNAKYIQDEETGLEKKARGDRRYLYYTEESLNNLRVKREELKAKARAILDETKPYEAEYRRRPWSRFFLVKNSGGHIHSSMSCSTCFPTTEFGWLPNLSGQSEPEAVAAHGAILCTVCYPSAPVEWTDRRDDSVCPGSGISYDPEQPKRTGFYSGNWGTCRECGTRQTVSKTGNIRKHKRAV